MNTTFTANLYQDGCVDKLTAEYSEAGTVETVTDWTVVAFEVGSFAMK